MAENCLLYYITDRRAFPGDECSHRRRLLEKIREAVEAGVDYIQLREKDLSTRELESLAREAVGVIHERSQVRTENLEPRTALLINSRADVALAVKAEGVHLRSDDISPHDVRTAWTECGTGTPFDRLRASSARQNSPGDPVIGVSCHSPAEVARAAAGAASFAVFAPVFEKKAAHPAGLEFLKEACRANISVLALGGITLANAHSCLVAGAAGIAAIRLFQDNDIAMVVKKLRG
ncbi:MAG TPA: thiamine phosphate synthase [Candidatus Sulfotelmatobacter sp.]|jgi:thiamine-phosphate pyrophosphorylase|nr:thiamine phosphate synthase [Candidatus Sulfotelmatobacter sp.]